MYHYSRKIHRIFMFLTIFLSLIMWLTGQVMEGNFLIIDDFTARKIHRLVSNFFSPILAIMGLTGLIMYFYPLIKKVRNKDNNQRP